MKEAKRFDRTNPCTKVDLHNCFYSAGGYGNRKLVDAKMVIGDNAPKYLLRNGYIEQRLIGGVDWYVVTIAGKAWLRAGIARHLELHPHDLARCVEPPAGMGGAKTRAKAPLLRRKRSA